jgi:predicted Holliday junction resolvase-like endonuclease
MVFLFVSFMVLLNVLAFLMFKRLHLLRSLSQIQAEVELEMHSRAHQLLVRRDQLEVGLLKESAELEDEQWKGDLAEYMEEYEQEALLRAKERLNRVYRV